MYGMVIYKTDFDKFVKKLEDRRWKANLRIYRAGGADTN